MSGLLEVLEGSLEHVSLGKGLGQTLDLVRNLIKPDIKERLSLLEHLLLEDLSHCLDLGVFPEENQVAKSLEIANTIEGWDLADWALSQLWQIVSLLLSVGEDVLDDLLHEDTVISLGGHSRVRRDDSLWDGAVEKEAASTAPLTADACHLLQVPGDDGLGCAEGADLSVLLTGWVHEQVLGFVVAEVEDDGTGQVWEEGVLLELVSHDWGIRLS